MKDMVSPKVVIPSMLASLLVIYFIDPIFTFLIDNFILVGGKISENVVDLMVVSAAKGQRNVEALIVASFVLGFFVAPAIGMAAAFIFSRKGKRRIDEIYEGDETDKNVKKPSLILKIVFLTFPLFLLLGSVFMFGQIYTNYLLTTTFEQRMAAISPYVSDQEYKEFRSSWALMRTVSDYNLINDELEKIANKNGIILPIVDLVNI